MTDEIAAQAVLFAISEFPINPGIIFFGGEPLLKKKLIRNTIAACKRIEHEKGMHCHFKLTTNGLLLDEPFLEYANLVGLMIALSIDGIEQAHNCNRKLISGAGTFEMLLPKINLLLKYQPYASALMVISPETIQYYSRSVDFLFQAGFKYIIASLNYAGQWSDNDIHELKVQYQKLAKWYEEQTLKQRKFYFSPFETKLATHIRGEDALCHRCLFGKEQVSIGFDGKIYPCVQFVGDGISKTEFSIGNVWDGIDEQKRDYLIQLSASKNRECQSCAINIRCNNNCSCLNWQTTGAINGISPILCETERLLVPIVDKLGERLYRQRASMFIQKHYNAVYPLLSLLEDSIK